MKKNISILFMMVVLFMMALCSCSKDEGNSLAGDKNDDLSGFSSETEVYNDIIGEWKLVRTVGPNIDYFKFFPDYSFICSSINAGINNYEGRYQIIEKKSEVGAEGSGTFAPREGVPHPIPIMSNHFVSETS